MSKATTRKKKRNHKAKKTIKTSKSFRKSSRFSKSFRKSSRSFPRISSTRNYVSPSFSNLINNTSHDFIPASPPSSKEFARLGYVRVSSPSLKKSSSASARKMRFFPPKKTSSSDRKMRFFFPKKST